MFQLFRVWGGLDPQSGAGCVASRIVQSISGFGMARRRHLIGCIVAIVASLFSSPAFGQDGNAPKSVVIFLDDFHIDFRNTPKRREALAEETLQSVLRVAGVEAILYVTERQMQPFAAAVPIIVTPPEGMDAAVAELLSR